MLYRKTSLRDPAYATTRPRSQTNPSASAVKQIKVRKFFITNQTQI